MSRPTTPTSEFLSNLESFLKKFKLTTENHKDQEILTLANLDSGRIRKFIVKKVDERSLFGRRNSQKSLKDENENKSRKNSFRKKKEKKEGKRKLSSSSLHSLKKDKKEGKRKLSSSSLHSLKMSCNKRFGSSKSLSTEVKNLPAEEEKKKRRSSFGSGKFKLGWGSSSESDSDDVFDGKQERNSSIHDANSDITDPGFTNEALVKDDFGNGDIVLPPHHEHTSNHLKPRNTTTDNSDTESISSMETDSPSSSPRFNLKMSPVPKRNQNKRVEPSYSPVSFRGGYQSNRSSISSVRKGILKKTNSCTTINMEMNNLSRPQTPTENKSIESFEETYSNGDTTRFARTGDNPHLRHQRSFNRVKFILDSGRPDNITGDYDDIKIEKNDKLDRTDKGKILTNSNEKRLTRGGKKCLIFSAGILIMSMAVVVGSLYGSRKALKALPVDGADFKFIASALEGKFKISNENFVPMLYNRNSEEFKKMSNSLEEFIVKAIFIEESVNEANSTIKLKIVRYDKGSVICTFRIKWQQDEKLELIEIKKRIWDYLEKYGAFGEYKVEKHSLSISELRDFCFGNAISCSHICALSEETLRFDCSCPDNLILVNDTNCVSLSSTSSTTTTTTAKTPVQIPPIINKILKVSNADLVSVNQETVSKDQVHHVADEKGSGSKDTHKNDTKVEETLPQNKTVSLMKNSTNESKEKSQLESPKGVDPTEEKVPPLEDAGLAAKDEENGIFSENETITHQKTAKTKYAIAESKEHLDDHESKPAQNKTELKITATQNESETDSLSNKTLNNNTLELEQKNDTSYNGSVTEKTQPEAPSSSQNVSDTESLDTVVPDKEIVESKLNEISTSPHEVTAVFSDKNDSSDDKLAGKSNVTDMTTSVNDLSTQSTLNKTISIDQEMSVASINDTGTGSDIEIEKAQEESKKLVDSNATDINVLKNDLPTSPHSNSSEASNITIHEPDVKIITLGDHENTSSINDFSQKNSYEYESDKSEIPNHVDTTHPPAVIGINEINNTTIKNNSTDSNFDMHVNNKNLSESNAETSVKTSVSTESQLAINNDTKLETLNTTLISPQLEIINETTLDDKNNASESLQSVGETGSENDKDSNLVPSDEKQENGVVSYATDHDLSNTTSERNISDPITIIALAPEILFTEDPNLNEVSLKGSKEEHTKNTYADESANTQLKVAKGELASSSPDPVLDSHTNMTSIQLESPEHKEANKLNVSSEGTATTSSTPSASTLGADTVSLTSDSEKLHSEIQHEEQPGSKETESIQPISNITAKDTQHNNERNISETKLVSNDTEKIPLNEVTQPESRPPDTQSTDVKNDTLATNNNFPIDFNVISNVSHDLSLSFANATQKNLSDSHNLINPENETNMPDKNVGQIQNESHRNSTMLCHEGELKCSDGSCYPKYERCNSVFYCFDHSDEEQCPENDCFDNYQCLLDNVCLERSFVCDGVKQCVGGDDEEGCETHECAVNEFDCGPESDKLCIPMKLKCDGHPDCFNHIDEINCTSQCQKDSFLCPEQTCIPNLWKCDGKSDCLNGEDEMDCGCEGLDQSPCNVGGCVPTFKVCDGLRQCPDGSDEWGCIKINKDTKKLQVRTSGERWSAVCGDNWTEEWTDLVCEQLGFGAPLSSEILPVTSPALIPRMKLSADAPDISRRRRAPLQYFLTHGECANDSLVHISCKMQECGNWNTSGTEALSTNNRIDNQLWPSLGWLIQEHGNSSSDFSGECTASVITHTWVLTSYSCLASNPQGFEAEKWAFMTGDLSPRARDGNTQLRYAKQIVIYPGAKRLRNKWVGDAALVRLQTPLKFSSNIQPICVPQTPQTQPTPELSNKDHCVVAFWDKILKDKMDDKSSLSPQVLQSVQKVNFTEINTCNTSYYGGLLNRRHICANFLQDKYASCKSHEGSPLMCKNAEGFWELHGLLSHVGNCASFNLPSIFTDIKAINTWIFNNLGRASSRKALIPSSISKSLDASTTVGKSSAASGISDTADISDSSNVKNEDVPKEQKNESFADLT